MKIPGLSGYTGVTDTARVRVSQTQQNSQSRSGLSPSRFDSIILSTSETAKASGTEGMLRNKITSDVCADTSAAVLHKLREEVQSGSYVIDTMSIARRMVLYTET